MRMNAARVIIIVAWAVAGAKAAPTEQVLYNFKYQSPHGSSPNAGLIRDASGNLYGTTMVGGDFNWGAVFELTPKTGGRWTEKVLHSFDVKSKDGADPWGTLVFDLDGNLYGTTTGGGACGTGSVFELIPQAGGNWTEKILYNFGCGSDGADPRAGLIFDSAGNLYGTTHYGGTGACDDGVELGCGTVFELTPQADGSWTETVLHSFSASGGDGIYPWAALIFDTAGNLYGTTTAGGPFTYGTVFVLTPQAGGGWKATLLHNFNGSDGNYPLASLTFDAAGNLYGVATGSDNYDVGLAFELMPKAGGRWTEKVLHKFTVFKEGSNPSSALIFDANGNLYGTTNGGGDPSCYLGCGVVFELTPPTKGGNWKEKVLHTFTKNGKDGQNSLSALIFDAANNLYGTTVDGGLYGEGTVFEIAH